MLVTGSYVEEQPGVSIRDEFAKAAMQAMLAQGDYDTADFEIIAQIAYDMAEAMMEQREKRP